MAEKLILHIQYECARHKIDIPWDNIAHRLNPGTTGGAILQRLNRLRTTLVGEGHLVPPIAQKPGSRVVVDSKIRGFVRKYPEGHEDIFSTRPVMYTEPLEDRQFNLPDAVNHPTLAWDDPNEPDEPDAVSSAPHNFSSQIVTPPQTAHSSATKQHRGRPIKKEPSPDPAELDSDAEYVPGQTTQSARRSLRASKRVKTYFVEDEELNAEDDEDAQAEQRVANDAADDVDGAKRYDIEQVETQQPEVSHADEVSSRKGSSLVSLAGHIVDFDISLQGNGGDQAQEEEGPCVDDARESDHIETTQAPMSAANRGALPPVSFISAPGGISNGLSNGFVHPFQQHNFMMAQYANAGNAYSQAHFTQVPYTQASYIPHNGAGVPRMPNLAQRGGYYGYESAGNFATGGFGNVNSGNTNTGNISNDIAVHGATTVGAATNGDEIVEVCAPW